ALTVYRSRPASALARAAVPVACARGIRDPAPPHRLPRRPPVRDVRDHADDEDPVHLRAERRADVRGRSLAGALRLQVRVVVLRGEEPPRDLANHADPSRPSSISRASACTSTLSNFAVSTIIISP